MPDCNDLRLNDLYHWLAGILGHPVDSFAPASSDASFRRYFRVGYAGRTAIVMDAPPSKENVAAFLAMGDLLRGAGIHVPDVYEADVSQGFLLLSDLGSTNYHDVWNTAKASELYQAALASLRQMQCRIDLSGGNGIPLYDESLLRRELHIFREWFLEGLLGVSLSSAEDTIWTNTTDLLVASALEQPQVFVHRDFHSRNLMVTNGQNPGVLDFQDAVQGPVTYDLVSLLRDCYIRWPRSQVRTWLTDFREMLCEDGVPGAENPRLFRRWFDFMGMQRHLKAIGIFSRLKLRDDKPGYLGDIPRTLGYVTGVAADYPELAGFGEILHHRVYPMLPRQFS